MSTNINISVGDNKLLAQASLQQNASRQAQLEKEANQRLEAQATDSRTKALASQGLDANGDLLTGISSQAPQLERRPAANRFGQLEAGWLFTEVGFLEGGQDGALRQYCTKTYLELSPEESFPLIDTVQSPAWAVENTQKPPGYKKTRIDWEQSGNCGGANNYRQEANLKLLLKAKTTTYLGIRIEGKGERQETGYDRLTVVYNDQIIGEAVSPGGGLGCAEAGPVVYTDLVSSDIYSWQLSANYAFLVIRVDRGLSSIELAATTVDTQFHVNAYYSYEFRVSKNPSFVWP